MSAELDQTNPEVLFRPAKRRKYLRRRPDTDDTKEEVQALEEGSSTPRSPPENADSIPSTEAARIRRFHRSRKGGIEFTAMSRPTAEQETKMALSTVTAEDVENDRMRAMSDRFTAHTGQTVDVDKHMMTYIETEMAKRYRWGLPSEASGVDNAAPNEANTALSTSELPERQPASLGKLHEIDLGQETKLQNIARTEAATRMLKSGDDGYPTGESDPRPASLTKGDRYRNRKRRTSEDIERDRLVEEVLRESKLDVYDEPEEEQADVSDLAADERVAEQFRRDFLDAIQSRRRVAKTKNTKQNKPDVPRGPKLGGSRSARAAMREMQEKSGRK